MIILALLGCAQPPPPATLPLMFDGCVAVEAGPRCLMRGASVRLWIEALPPLDVRVDGQRVAVPAQIEGGGVLLDVPAPVGAEEVVIADETGRIGRLLLGEAPPDAAEQPALLAGLSSVEAAIHRGDVVAAEAHLQQLQAVLPGDIRSAWQVAHWQGELAGYRGDHRAAMGHYRMANQLAGRLLEPVNTTTLVRLAENLAAVGRHREARQLLRDVQGCVSQEARAWLMLEAVELSGVERAPIRALDCPTVSRVALSKARDALRLEDLDAMAAALQDAAPLGHDEALWALYLQGRLHQRRGELAVAREVMDSVIASTGEASPRHRWQALVAQGEILAALKQPAEAIVVLHEARAVLLRHSLMVPLHNGRDRFLSRGLSADRLLVTLLLEEGQVEDALTVIRSARLQLLQGLLVEQFSVSDQARWAAAVAHYTEARAAVTPAQWTATGEQSRVLTTLRRRQKELARQAFDAGTPQSLPALSLRSPEPGELMLAWFELGEGWVGIAASSDAVLAASIDDLGTDPSPEARAGLLAPFAAQIASAEVLTLLPHGPLRGENLHMLPLDGRPLLEHLPVRYSLDLPPRSPRPAGIRAAVVSDPRLNLHGAREEAERVAASLAQAGWTVDTLSGTEAARSALLSLLSGVSMLHYAGHGERNNIVTESAFLVAAGERLTVGDLLTLAQAPQTVVLSTCDGAASPAVAAESLGLAQAFLLAGAEQVIAAVEPVQDSDSRVLMERLYASPADPVGAWRDAVLVSDAAPYRLMVP